MRIYPSAAWAIALGMLVSGCAAAIQSGHYGSMGIDTAQSVIDQTDKAIVLDVREPHEYDAGHVPGAVNVPLSTVADWAADQPKDARYLVICETGRRSARASQVLIDQGFTDVTNVDGGTSAWRDKGYPIER